METRESLTVIVLRILQNVTAIKVVERKRYLDEDSIKEIPSTKLPLVGLTGADHRTTLKRSSAGPVSRNEVATSTLSLLATCYYQTNKGDLDTMTNFLLSELWSAVQEFEDWGEGVLFNDVQLLGTAYQDEPYGFFTLQITLTYVHKPTKL